MQTLEVPRAVLDATSFPVVTLTERGTLADADRVRIMEGLDELVDRRGRHAVVIDLTRGALLPQAQRTFVTETFFQMREHLIVEKWACLAVIVGTPVLKFMPLAAFWLKVCPVPGRMFPSLSEGTAWARSLATARTTCEIPVLASPIGVGKARPAR